MPHPENQLTIFRDAKGAFLGLAMVIRTLMTVIRVVMLINLTVVTRVFTAASTVICFYVAPDSPVITVLHIYAISASELVVVKFVYIILSF